MVGSEDAAKAHPEVHDILPIEHVTPRGLSPVRTTHHAHELRHVHHRLHEVIARRLDVVDDDERLATRNRVGRAIGNDPLDGVDAAR